MGWKECRPGRRETGLGATAQCRKDVKRGQTQSMAERKEGSHYRNRIERIQD